MALGMNEVCVCRDISSQSYLFLIGASLSEPHTSVTALCMCVYVLFAWTDHFYTVNFKMSAFKYFTKIEIVHGNWSYPKVVPRADFGCQKWSPRTTFGCQKWSHLAKTGPSRTKFGNQYRSREPLLAAKSAPLDQFG